MLPSEFPSILSSADPSSTLNMQINTSDDDGDIMKMLIMDVLMVIIMMSDLLIDRMMIIMSTS
jgi:hypothetical protein